MRKYLRLLSSLPLLCLPVLVQATTIVAVRTGTDIYIGVDSKVARFSPYGAVEYEGQCKVQQQGNILFVAAGPYDRGPVRLGGPRLSITSSLIAAQAAGGTIHQIVNRFDDSYADAMLETLRDVNVAVYEKAVHDPGPYLLFWI